MSGKRRRVFVILSTVILATELVIALFVRDSFVRPYVGDVLVTVLLCSLCRIVVPNKMKALPVFVFIFATLVELMQYFDIVKLLGLEGNRLISTLVGRTFSFADIVCYAIGCLLFYGIERIIQKSGVS